MAALLTRSFVALMVAQASFGFAFACFFLLPKFLTTELGATASQIGLVGASFGVTSVLLGPPMGAVVDRHGRRRFMTAGALLMAAASAGFLLVEALGPAVYLLRALQGAAFAMAFVAGSAMAVDEAPPERLSLALGIFGLTMLTMNAVAPAAVEEVAARAGWEPAFAMASASALLCAVLSRRVRDVRPEPAPDGARSGLLEIARRPRFLRIAVVVGLAGMAFMAMFTYHQPFALELGIERVRTFFVAYTIAAVGVRLGLGPYIDRVGRHRVSVLALALYGVSTLAMARLGVLGLAPLGAAFGVAHGLFYPTFNALAVEGIGAHERGKLMALFNGAFNVGGTVGLFGLGYLAEAAGFPAVFAVAGSGALVGLAVLAASPEGRRGVEPASDPGSRPAPPAPAAGGS